MRHWIHVNDIRQWITLSGSSFIISISFCNDRLIHCKYSHSSIVEKQICLSSNWLKFHWIVTKIDNTLETDKCKLSNDYTNFKGMFLFMIVHTVFGRYWRRICIFYQQKVVWKRSLTLIFSVVIVFFSPHILLHTFDWMLWFSIFNCLIDCARATAWQT